MLVSYSAYAAPTRERVGLEGSIKVIKIQGNQITADISCRDVTDIDETHDRRRTSWIASANGHPDFPIQNLPFGVFSPAGGPPRGGVAIGAEILDIEAALEAGLVSGEAERAARAASGPSRPASRKP